MYAHYNDEPVYFRPAVDVHTTVRGGRTNPTPPPSSSSSKSTLVHREGITFEYLLEDGFGADGYIVHKPSEGGGGGGGRPLPYHDFILNALMKSINLMCDEPPIYSSKDQLIERLQTLSVPFDVLERFWNLIYGDTDLWCQNQSDDYQTRPLLQFIRTGVGNYGVAESMSLICLTLVLRGLGVNVDINYVYPFLTTETSLQSLGYAQWKEMALWCIVSDPHLNDEFILRILTRIIRSILTMEDCDTSTTASPFSLLSVPESTIIVRRLTILLEYFHQREPKFDVHQGLLRMVASGALKASPFNRDASSNNEDNEDPSRLYYEGTTSGPRNQICFVKALQEACAAYAREAIFKVKRNVCRVSCSAVPTLQFPPSNFTIVAYEEIYRNGPSVGSKGVPENYILLPVEFPVHDWIMIQWPFFRRMIQSQMSETTSRRLDLPEEFRADAFRCILGILYGVDLNSTLECGSALTHLSQSSMIFLLQNAEEYSLVPTLNEEAYKEAPPQNPITCDPPAKTWNEYAFSPSDFVHVYSTAKGTAVPLVSWPVSGNDANELLAAGRPPSPTPTEKQQQAVASSSSSLPDHPLSHYDRFSKLSRLMRATLSLCSYLQYQIEASDRIRLALPMEFNTIRLDVNWKTELSRHEQLKKTLRALTDALTGASLT